MVKTTDIVAKSLTVYYMTNSIRLLFKSAKYKNITFCGYVYFLDPTPLCVLPPNGNILTFSLPVGTKWKRFLTSKQKMLF